MANRLNWTPGRKGKGLISDTGDVHTWNVDYAGNPHHQQYGQNQNLRNYGTNFFIDPDGFVSDDTHDLSPTDTRAILSADPNLHNYGQQEDWSLDGQNIPGVEDTEGPDWNFIMHGSNIDDPLGLTNIVKKIDLNEPAGENWEMRNNLVYINGNPPCPECGHPATVGTQSYGGSQLQCGRCKAIYDRHPIEQFKQDLNRLGSTEDPDEYSDMLKAWLDDIEAQDPAPPPTPHHDSIADIAPGAPPVPAEAPPYWPPGHVPDWAEPAAGGRTGARPAPEPENPEDETTTGGWLHDNERLIEQEISPAEYDEALDERVSRALAKSAKKPRGPWLARLLRRR